MMTIKVNFYLYLFFFFLYNLQGILYPSGSLLSQSAVLILIVQGLLAFQYALRMRPNPSFIHLWSVFVIFVMLVFIASDKVVYGTSYEMIGKVSVFGQFKGILVFLLTIYVAYTYARLYKVSENLIFSISIALIVLSLMRYGLNYYTLLNSPTIQSIEGFTNNASYNLVCSLALLVLVMRRSKGLAIGIFIVLAYLIMLAAKRGAIVCLFAVFLVSLFYYSRQNTFSMKKVLAAAVLFAIFSAAIYYIYMSNEYLQHRMEVMDHRGIGTRSVAYDVL